MYLWGWKFGCPYAEVSGQVRVSISSSSAVFRYSTVCRSLAWCVLSWSSSRKIAQQRHFRTTHLNIRDHAARHTNRGRLVMTKICVDRTGSWWIPLHNIGHSLHLLWALKCILKIVDQFTYIYYDFKYRWRFVFEKILKKKKRNLLEHIRYIPCSYIVNRSPR